MEIFDISQELTSAYVYPGDPRPTIDKAQCISEGDKCNLTTVFMCCHNGTHIDAPYHFINDGKTIDEIELKMTVGECLVACLSGRLSKEDIIGFASSGTDKLLIKGDIEMTEEAAVQLVESGIHLIGVESCTVGTNKTGEKIHKILLNQEIVILEGLRLENIQPEKYFLCAQPLKIFGADGAPCRAILIGGL